MEEPTQPIRKSFVIITVCLVVLIAGACIAYYSGHRNPPGPGPTPAAIASEGSNSVAELSSQKHAVPPVAVAPDPVEAKPLTVTAPAPVVSPEARELVSRLAQLNITNGPLTQEKLSAWQATLQQITNVGPAVVPAIREFLQTRQDASFESVGGSAVLGQPSLRLAMLDALSKIGGPEAVALSGESLRSTTDPREIALLARNLEQQSPGEFRQAAVDAARAALNEAIAGKMTGTDVGALFSVLQQYGGADVTADFQNAKGRFTYYTAIALGGLPDGAGIPALAEMAQDTSGAGRISRAAALQALAQLAPDNPAAREAFLQQAQNSSMPAATWIKIGALLGGEQLQLGGQPDSGIPDSTDPKKSTYHLSSGNQNFYTISVLEKLSGDQVNQRVQLIDQLLAANRDAAAVDSLQRARNLLTGRQQTTAK